MNVKKFAVYETEIIISSYKLSWISFDKLFNELLSNVNNANSRVLFESKTMDSCRKFLYVNGYDYKKDCFVQGESSIEPDYQGYPEECLVTIQWIGERTNTGFPKVINHAPWSDKSKSVYDWEKRRYWLNGECII